MDGLFWSFNRNSSNLYQKRSIYIEKDGLFIEIWSKSRLSIWICRWNPNRTVIDDRIQTEILIRRRWFDLVPLIALAYNLHYFSLKNWLKSIKTEILIKIIDFLSPRLPSFCSTIIEDKTVVKLLIISKNKVSTVFVVKFV